MKHLLRIECGGRRIGEVEGVEKEWLYTWSLVYTLKIRILLTLSHRFWPFSQPASKLPESQGTSKVLAGWGSSSSCKLSSPKKNVLAGLYFDTMYLLGWKWLHQRRRNWRSYAWFAACKDEGKNELDLVCNFKVYFCSLNRQRSRTFTAMPLKRELTKPKPACYCPSDLTVNRYTTSYCRKS